MFGGITVEDVRTSNDGTIKFLSRLEDGLTIESVLYRRRGGLRCASQRRSDAPWAVFFV